MKTSLLPKKLNYHEMIIFVSSFLFFYSYISSYGLTLDTDELYHINYFSELVSRGIGVKFPVYIKPIPVLLASSGYYLSPYMYEFVTAIFSSILILFTFKLCAILFDKRIAVLASILVLINPMTFRLTLGGNSIIIQAALVFVSYYLLVSTESCNGKRIALSLFFLVLSCLTRPEPWIFIPLIPYYAIFVKRFRIRGILIWSALLAIIIPILWLLGDYLITGEWWWTKVNERLQMVLFYNVTSFTEFPTTFIRSIDYAIISAVFIFLSVVGFFSDVKNIKRASILPLSFLLLFLFYWILAWRVNVIVPRFFYIHYLVIAIYSSVGIFFIFDRLPLRAKYKKTLLLVLIISSFAYYTEWGKIIDSRRIMQFTSRINRDIVRSSHILKRKLSEEKYSSVLMSSRRIPLIRLEMRGSDNVRLTSYRQFYYQKSTFKEGKIDWIIYDVNDIYPPPVQKYFKKLFSSEQTLQKEGIVVSKIYKVSDNTLLLRIRYK